MAIETPPCPHCRDDRQAEPIQGSARWFCNCCGREFAVPKMRDADVIKIGGSLQLVSCRVWLFPEEDRVIREENPSNLKEHEQI